MKGSLHLLVINSNTKILKNFLEIGFDKNHLFEREQFISSLESDDRILMTFVVDCEFPKEFSNRTVWDITILSRTEFEKLKDGFPIEFKIN